MLKMYHDDPKMTGGPTTADVPEEAVAWMQKCGWYVKTAAPAKETTAKEATATTAKAPESAKK